MRIQHNIMAMNSYRNYTSNTGALGKNLEKLSSGYKINRAGDDAAGLAISEKMRAQITGLEQAQTNAKDGISLVQTAEGALTEVHSMLNRMVKLADQSANGTYDDGVDRANLQKEVTSLSKEIDRIADSSNFNGIKLLNGDRAAYKTNAATSTENGVRGAFVTGGFLGSGDKVKFGLTASGAMTAAAQNGSASVSGVTFTFAQTADGKEGGVFTAVAKVTSSDEAIRNAWEGVTVSLVVDKATDKAIGTGSGATNPGEFVATPSAGVVITATPQDGATGALTLQIGDTAAKFNQLSVSVGDMHTEALGIAGIDISTQTGAQSAVDLIRNSINMVSSTRGDLGALQNRLDHTISNLSVMQENIQDAESSVRDVDVAKEMMSYTKNNILVQSAQAMLAQANQVPQGVLQLLQ